MRSLRDIAPVVGMVVGLFGLLGGSTAQAEEVPWMGANGWMQWHPHRSDYTLAVVGTQTYFGPGAIKAVTRGVEPPAPVVKAPEPAKAESPKPAEAVKPAPEPPKPAEVSKEPCPGTPKGVKLTPAGCWQIDLVNFDFDKAKIREDEKAGLNEVAKVMQENANIKLEIQGHTDNMGPDAYNKVLSEKRAKAVREYLIAKGVAGNRLESSGYSFSKPIAPNDTRVGRAENRRVEIVPKY